MNINSIFNKINIKSKKDKTSSENSNFGVIGKKVKPELPEDRENNVENTWDSRIKNEDEENKNRLREYKRKSLTK